MGAAYGRMKSSRYETYSDNSKYNESNNNNAVEE